MAQRDDEFFWEAARQGRLVLRACSDCGRIAHPPVPMCPQCHALAWTEQQLSGRGRLYSWILSRHPSQPDASARIVALIELEEGVRLVSNIRDADPASLSEGAPVTVFFDEVNGHVLPQFRLEEARA
jgi:uncharacterized OB-fold protein